MLSKNLNRFSPLILLVSAAVAPAEVRLPKVLSSHMVMQREMPLHLWGWSQPGEQVTASLQGVSGAATGDRLGHWSLYLPPQAAGGPFQITIAASNKIVLEDVLFGDVWFASGQSNMEMPLAGFPASAVIKNSAEEIAHANQPGIRLLFVNKKSSIYPLEDIESDRSWTVCSPETAARFSAVAYFFGRDLATHEHVPIGLIDSSWGGTPAESWISLDGLGADASLMPVFAARAQMVRQQANKMALREAEKREDAEALSKNLPAPKHAWQPDPDSWEPAGLFNGMVAPLVGYGIKGAIWYQGESNASPDRAPLYDKLFPALIADWHRVWGEGNFPFLFVQLANYNASPADQWPVIREAQRHTPFVGPHGPWLSQPMWATPATFIPPISRLWGRALRYGLARKRMARRWSIRVRWFRQANTDNEAIRVWFDQTGTALKTKSGGAPEGFEIAGADRRFVGATARVDGASVLVSSPQVKLPKYVRYGWQNNPVLSLYNASDLPASPFTSEKE